MKSIEELAALAAEVGSQHEAQKAARKRAKDEAAETLAQVLSAVEPALEAICTNIVVKESVEPKGIDRNPKPNRTKHKSRGLRVLGEGPQFGEGAMSGPVDGEDVFLLESGTLATVRYSGTWRGYRKEKYEWSASVREVDPQQLLATHEPVAVKQIVDRIHVAIEAQHTGNKQKRTDDLIEISQLMGSIGHLLGYKAPRRRPDRPGS